MADPKMQEAAKKAKSLRLRQHARAYAPAARRVSLIGLCGLILQASDVHRTLPHLCQIHLAGNLLEQLVVWAYPEVVDVLLEAGWEDAADDGDLHLLTEAATS